MKIAIHIGVHCTDEDQLLKSLLKNTDLLTKHGVAVPGPSRYRNLLRDVVVKLDGARASEDSEDMVLEQILDGSDPEQMVLSFEHFLCGVGRVLEDGILYPVAGEKSKRLRDVFPSHEVEFHMAVRDPATFVPALLTKYPELDRDAIMVQLNLAGMVWSDVVRDIREANPDCQVVVWCNEDTPLVWPEVMHGITGLDESIGFKGGLDIINLIMQQEGIKRLRAYMAEHEPVNETQRRKVVAAFLDKYAIEDAVEEEIDMPGWTEQIVDELSASYDEDMAEMRGIEGVRVISV